VSYGRSNATEVLVHHIGDDQNTLCGQWGAHQFTWTFDRTAVTCKRCLASLAKRDRAFQRKARRWFGSQSQCAHMQRTIGRDRAEDALHPWRHTSRKADAARAIAREEGRAL
jgi:hypothetical protein